MSSPTKLNTRVTRRIVLAGGAATGALLAGCAPWRTMTDWIGGKPKPAPALAVKPDQGARLKQVLDELSVAWLKQSPEFATSLGVSEAQAGGRYLDWLSDYSAAGMQRAANIEKTTLAALDQLDRGALSPQDQVSLDVVHEALSIRLAGSRFAFGVSGLSEPTPYIVTQLSGGYINVPSFLDSQHPIRNATDVDYYLARVSEFATVLDQEVENINRDASGGVVPPDFVIDGALKQLRGLVAKSARENFIVQSLKARIPQAQGMAGPSADKAVKDATTLVAEKVVPALRRQIDTLARLRKGALHDAGIWRVKDGERFYSVALRAFTTSSLAPDDIHKMGLDLVKDLGGQMDMILKQQGMTQGTLAQRLAKLSKDPKQLYANTDTGRAKLLADLNAQIETLQPYMAQNFGTLAKAKVEVRRVPPFKEAGSPGGYYEQGSLDGSRPGYYFINLRNTAEWPKFTLPTLTYHEAEPGHHWQGSIALETSALPFVRSALLWFSGYGEGWALYSEMLADEMGLYKDDPFGRLGYLQSAAFRAARLVVDTGLHSKRWSREQAIDFMVEATGDQRSSIATEVERYAVWPGQACSYMLGRQTIRSLRESAKAKLGPKFDIKAFHDVVLRNGAVPLGVLETIVKGWVAAELAPPNTGG
jgi:uncharacterized protein (DUF885 family)